MLFKRILNITPSFCNLQFVRTTTIVKRTYPPKPITLKNGSIFFPKPTDDSYVYKFENFTNWQKAGDIDLILAADVTGLGFAGDVVKVTKKRARSSLLPTGVAIYASPDNLAKTEHLRKMNKGKKFQPESAEKTMKEIAGMTVSIPMNHEKEWTLNQTHVKVGFRICGVELTEDSIELPETPITTPGEYFVKITVNGLSSVEVKLNVYGFSKILTAVLPPVWSKDPKYLFDFEDVVADVAINMKKRII